MAASPALAQLLADRRKTFNGRVATVRTRSPGFDTAALSAFLVGALDPLLAAVLAERPDSGAAFVDAAFDMAVALAEQGWAGEQPRAQVVRDLWREVAPGIARLIAANPRETLGPLTNAAIKLAGEPGVKLTDWMDRLRRLGGRAGSPAELRELAIMAAWRAGAAHLRGAALVTRIDPALACMAVGAEAGVDWAGLVAGFGAHRWWTPDCSAPQDGHRIGAFIGFGGRFAEPPRLGVLGDSFILSSAGEHYLLEADAYGATLRPVDPEQGEAAQPAPAAALESGHLRAADRLVPCEWPQDGLHSAATADSIAVVSRLSYAVRVMPRSLP
ncbi:MAG TPA: hypothetical protein VF481_01305 [Novosphingobium sp.]